MTHAALTSQAKPVIKIVGNNPDFRICYRSSRAISTIQKMPNGKYVVVKLYEEETTECDHYSTAKKEAASAAMTQAPRTTKDAA